MKKMILSIRNRPLLAGTGKGLFICGFHRDGAAWRDGRLCNEDQLVSINGFSVENRSVHFYGHPAKQARACNYQPELIRSRHDVARFLASTLRLDKKPPATISISVARQVFLQTDVFLMSQKRQRLFTNALRYPESVGEKKWDPNYREEFNASGLNRSMSDKSLYKDHRRHKTRSFHETEVVSSSEGESENQRRSASDGELQVYVETPGRPLNDEFVARHPDISPGEPLLWKQREILGFDISVDPGEKLGLALEVHGVV